MSVNDRNVPPNPFPMSLPSGRRVVDERCRCGHKRSEHGHTVGWGHGECRSNSTGPLRDSRVHRQECICTKFTWKASIYGGKK